MDSMYLHLSQDEISYYLVDNENFYMLVKLDGQFREIAFRRMLRRAPRPIQEWRAEGLSVRGIPKSAIRRVGMKGNDSITEIELCVREEFLLFHLEELYEEVQLKAFFPKLTVVRSFITDKEIREIRSLRDRATFWLHLIAFAIDLVFLLYPRPYWLWSTLCIGTQVVSVTLYLLFPLTFELDGGRRKGDPPIPGNLIDIPVVSGLLLLIRTAYALTMTPQAFPFIALLSVGISLALMIGIVLRRRFLGCFYGSPILQLLGGWFLTFFLSFGAVGHIFFLLT